MTADASLGPSRSNAEDSSVLDQFWACYLPGFPRTPGQVSGKSPQVGDEVLVAGLVGVFLYTHPGNDRGKSLFRNDGDGGSKYNPGCGVEASILRVSRTAHPYAEIYQATSTGGTICINEFGATAATF